MDQSLVLGLTIFAIIVVLAIVYGSVKIVSPYEQGIYIRLGTFMRVLNPGINVVTPIVSQVIKMDLRTQVLDVPSQEVIQKIIHQQMLMQ